MKKRGQISFEYLALVAIVSVIVIFILGISQFYSRQVETTINAKQVDTLAKEIIDTAESVYYFGQPTKNTFKVQMPAGIDSITINTTFILFTISTQGGKSSLLYPSTVPIAGNISPFQGIHTITIEARGNITWINGT